MNNQIRFTAFGNFGNLSTSNTNNYIKLIEFFNKRGYSAATFTEFTMQPGAVSPTQYIMPVFIRDNNKYSVEFSSERITAVLNIGEVEKICNGKEEFESKLLQLYIDLFNEFEFKSNRLAFNFICNSKYDQKFNKERYIISSFMNNSNDIGISNVATQTYKQEVINLILQRKYNEVTGFQTTYDINTNALDKSFRFDGNNFLEYWNLFNKYSESIQERIDK